MIQAFVEKNRRLLIFYSKNIRTVGWIFIFIGLFGTIVQILQISTGTIVPRIILGISYIPLGLLILGLADIFKFLLNPEQKVSWILRHGDLILYAYAAVIASAATWGVISIGWPSHSEPEASIYLILAASLPWIVLSIIKVLVLVSIGPLVRRIVPVIEEAMTLA